MYYFDSPLIPGNYNFNNTIMYYKAAENLFLYNAAISFSFYNNAKPSLSVLLKIIPPCNSSGTSMASDPSKWWDTETRGHLALAPLFCQLHSTAAQRKTESRQLKKTSGRDGYFLLCPGPPLGTVVWSRCRGAAPRDCGHLCNSYTELIALSDIAFTFQ